MLELPNCHKRRCKHFQGVAQPDGTEITEVDVCSAFPDGIPDEITDGDNLHSVPLPLLGQENDIVYEEEGE